MARTKNQTRTAHTRTTRRLTVVNGMEGSQVGTTTKGADWEEGSSATSSERSRRAARRGKAALASISTAAREDGVRAREETEETDTGDEDNDSGDCHMTPATGGICSENYYTALEGEEEGNSAREPSEAPNIKSPHTPRRGGPRGGQARDLGAGNRSDGGRGATEEQRPS